MGDRRPQVLNVPYDSGLAIVGDPGTLGGAMSVQADYLPDRTRRDPYEFTPETSRRMRGVEIWAAIASLGRDGVEELVEHNCRQARRFAERLRESGCEILNDVVLNQVLVAFGDDAVTAEVIRGVQRDGTCWCGGTFWNGRAAMRISVSSWATTDEDVERSIEAILRVADHVRGQAPRPGLKRDSASIGILSRGARRRAGQERTSAWPAAELRLLTREWVRNAGRCVSDRDEPSAAFLIRP